MLRVAGEKPVGGNRASEASGPARYIAPFFEDPSLRVLLIIFVVHVTLGGALLLLAGLRDGSVSALAAIALLGVASGDAVRRARQRARIAKWLIGLWLGSIATAWISSRLGIL